ELGLDPAGVIKLASNENPLGPSPRAQEALRRCIPELNRYPDGTAFRLTRAVAKKCGVEPGQVVFGNGSNELIELVGHAFLKPGDSVVISQYAFAIYEIVAKLFQAKLIEVPAKEYGHDADAMLAAIRPGTRVVFVANPNNPTGTVWSSSELRRFVDRVPDGTLIVLDEAYQEFLPDAAPSTEWIASRPQLLILRTFSKAHGLAGLRIGYAIGSPETIAALERVRQPFNANLAAQEAALAALGDAEHLEATRKNNAEGRKFLAAALEKMGIELIPSHANFILARVGDGQKCFERLLRAGVIVRPMGGYKLGEWIRVTVGTAIENARFLEALAQVERERKQGR
ncbi:MAG: histidinol-phosphate transaminase, partial [Verrucomicrobiae bacterium]|nr:histidinol-phosphate transaminase [Verrucomicrobiae bacterium]